jgi:ubiquinone/menaquinone biosynthesis C-methylase UbiE
MERASDWFGAVAASYARHRLTYPQAFFSQFTAKLPGQRVWDCGCGSGQASRDLAAQGLDVIATDASAEQLALAPSHPQVSYRCAPADASGLGDASVDGVLVAAAVHWFAGDAFNNEVRRVCKPGAVMAWIGYLPLQLEPPELQARVDHFYAHTLQPFWPAERQWVDQSYRGLPFPGEEWAFPSQLWIERRWTLDQLMGYLGTWSAVQRSRQQGLELLTPLQLELAQAWPGPGAEALLVRWPFMGRWGRVR